VEYVHCMCKTSLFNIHAVLVCQYKTTQRFLHCSWVYNLPDARVTCTWSVSPLPQHTQTMSFEGLWCLTPLSTIFQLYRGGQVEATGVPGENQRPDVSHWQIWSHNVVSSTPRPQRDSDHNFSGDRHWLHK
jgi:hypothetical protein